MPADDGDDDRRDVHAPRPGEDVSAGDDLRRGAPDLRRVHGAVVVSGILTWIVAHPAEAIAAGYALLNAVNGALPKRRGWAGGALDKAHVVLDRLCVLTRSDAPGTIKVPGAKSR